MKRRIWPGILVTLTLAAPAWAQIARQGGAIKGVATDSQGAVLVGMSVAAESPALLGKAVVLTDKGGAYRLANLPPGTYTVTGELKGFKIVKRTGIEVQVGQVFTVNLATELSPLREEIVVSDAPPVVDVQSGKLGGVISAEMIRDLPLNRSLVNIFSTVAGANGTIDTYSGSIHGGTSTTVSAEIDGVNDNDPTHNGILVTPQFDSMEEIEISTGGLPAQVGNTGGAFINMVTKSGGNQFHGQLQMYYTRENLTQNLYSDAELEAKGMSIPVLPFFDLNTSASLGGPIKKDRVWFFTTLSRIATKYHTGFIPTTVAGKAYEAYPDPDNNYEAFGKVTAQLSRKLRFFAMVNGRDRERDVFDPGSKRAYDATFTLKGNTWLAATGNLTWLVSPNTFVDLRGGYTNRWYPITAKDETRSRSGYRDDFTGYFWNAPTNGESQITRRTHQASVRLSHYRDGFLGGNHELAVGVEYQHGLDRYGMSKGNPVNFVQYNGNPYYYRGRYGLTGPHPTFGDGLLTLNNMGTEIGDTSKDLLFNRISAYVQDAFTLGNRFTVNAGLRLDSYTDRFGGTTSTGTPGLPAEIGKTLERSLGFDPFGPTAIAGYDIAAFSSLSPRIGFSYDPKGDGKTAIKLAFSRYSEALPVMRVAAAQPSSVGGNFDFNWWDLNGNGQPDNPGTDRYAPRSGLGVFSKPDIPYLQGLVADDLKAPTYNEITASISREIARNFSLRVQYIHKRGFEDFNGARYDTVTRRFWYKYEQAPEWWVPFTTTVPAVGTYPAQTVTAYFMSNSAPEDTSIFKAINSPDSRRRYNAVELTFDKRLSNGWALGGSVVYSGLKTITGDDFGDNPNNFVNGYGRNWFDVPFALKVYGTTRLPLSFMASFFYQHTSRTPYNETVTVFAPAGFAAAHDLKYDTAWLFLEPRGSRRLAALDNVDLRLQKDIKVKAGTVALWVDVFNALGNRYDNIGADAWLSTLASNPDGEWHPTAEHATTGEYVNGYNYGRTVQLTGARVFKFSARLTF